MGEPWRAGAAWEVVSRAEQALGEALGHLLTDAPPSTLARTREAQLAVLLTSLVAWEAVRERIEPPIAFAGHSLGQLTALVAAGALELEDGVRLAARRGECTQAAAERRPGRMAALLGASVEQAEDACAGGRPTAGGGHARSCWVANDNAPGQVVVGGTPDGVDAAVARARAGGVRRAQLLNVAGAFHTPLMEEARVAFVPALEAPPWRSPAAPVVSNGDARPYRDGEGWRARLADHLVRPVRWRASMETLVELGADAFVEVGPGGLLAGLARRAVPGVEVRGVAVPDDVPALSEVA